MILDGCFIIGVLMLERSNVIRQKRRIRGEETSTEREEHNWSGDWVWWEQEKGWMKSVTVVKNTRSSFLDVSFRNGVMEIPKLCIFESTMPLVRKLIAFEQCYPLTRNHVKFYVVLMQFLLDTPRSYLTDVFHNVNGYSDSRWHRWRAVLARDYFSSPWTVISRVAAIVLLILTLLQTYYSMYGYYHPH
ncbi:hypothetical protein QJS10_CPB17g01122 [Acorus calamus]|uniref:Uncharacterized protein n=1 Tax=Acorus calamus TaxID=4465 RepID=A0AAV9CVH9_ACOCL|nr:hypothetical protein QJS10_CPB17g01122 [Acorus calamus]